MGDILSKPKPPSQPPSPPMLSRPWRKTKPWTSELRTSLFREVKNFKPQHKDVDRAKILLVGQTGAGKSSFLNTISSILRGHVKCPAQAGTNESKSITLQYREYLIKCTPTSYPLNFLFCDTQGLQQNYGFTNNEFEFLVEGNVINRHVFNQNAEMTPKTHGYRESPSLADKAHCVCFIFDASTVTQMQKEVKEKFTSFVEKLRDKDLSFVVLLTKIDKVDEEVRDDCSKVYKSKKIQKKVKSVSEFLHVPLSLVIPMKNYDHEHDLDDSLDILAFLSMRQILRAAETFLEKI